MARPRAGTAWASKVRQEGPRELAARVARRTYRRLDAGRLEFPLLEEDVADSAAVSAPTPVPVTGALRVGWLVTPPGLGSGGHTTLFRMVEAMEAAGHRCVVVLYDRHHGDPVTQASVIREGWPDMRAEIRGVDEGFADLDACVATSWPTAHVLARRATRLHRFYFIQDFEPFFHSRGADYELAAETYRFGFTHIALGHMVQDRLLHEVGASSHMVPFSCDTATYRLENLRAREGVVFYARPGNPRRGYELGLRTLRELHRRRPEQTIHLFGDDAGDTDFPVVRHGRLTPAELNALYNSVAAGLALSFTNISLVAEEMLAAGAIPVVNSSPDARADLDSPHVAWAAPSPGALADAFCRVLDHPDPAGRVVHAAGSVRADNWARPGRELVEIVEAATAGGLAGGPRGSMPTLEGAEGRSGS
ncbi:rhamnosyltransferase WsaF family glycosyltransferase [Nocardioides donggukensis]